MRPLSRKAVSFANGSQYIRRSTHIPPMQEIEVKILGIDQPKVEARLRELGARELARGTLRALLFDTPDRMLRARREHLRLRTGPHGTTLTHKGAKEVRDGAKVCEETEVRLDDFEKARAILGRLGLRVELETVKERVSYALRDVHVEIDAYMGEHAFIPVFLEIEGPDIPAIHACALELGYAPGDCKAYGFGDLVRHYAGEKGLDKRMFSNTRE